MKSQQSSGGRIDAVETTRVLTFQINLNSALADSKHRTHSRRSDVRKAKDIIREETKQVCPHNNNNNNNTKFI